MSTSSLADDLQERIGYRFADPALLERALVHRSWAHDQSPPANDNERLEFLGDAVLGLVIAERLFSDFGDDEGRLTRARSNLVRKETLAAQARKIDLGLALSLGKGEVSGGGRDKDSILCDAFEALIGAIYRDSGLEVVRDFITRVMADELASRGGDGELRAPRDPRTQLQEVIQSRGKVMPVYEVVGSSGPPHEPVWEVEVSHEGRRLGVGTGRNKQDASREAAKKALGLLRLGGGSR